MALDLVTFDCYGTLIDWRTGILEAFHAAIPRSASVAPERLLEAYGKAEAEVESGPFRRYRRVLAEAATRTARRLGLERPPEAEGFLAESLPTWEPFPDTNPALERLRRLGLRLGILSNVDDDLLAGTLERLPGGFDLLVTAESVGSYKPAPGHFERARRAVGGETHRWLHVAQSLHHDIGPAEARGIPSLWVNRLGESRAAPAGAGERVGAAEVPDLAAAAEWIERRLA